MKIVKKSNWKKNKMRLIAATTLVAVLVLGSLVYVYAFSGDILGWPKNDNPSQEKSSTSNQQQENGSQIKDKSLSDQGEESTTSGSDQPPNPVKTNGESRSKVEVTITSPSEQSGTSFTVRSYVSASTTSGVCSVALEAQGRSPITKSATGLQPQSDISACQTFEIPMDQLSSGDWKLTVSFENDTLTGTATQSVKIN